MIFDFTPYRVIVPLLACFIVIYAWNHVLRGTKTIWEALLWTVFWGAIAVIVLFPSWISVLTTWTGIRDQANAVFAIAIGILLFVVFLIIVRLEKMEKRITDMVRREALSDAGLREPPDTHFEKNDH
jgi:hypothetical protein